MYLYVALSLKKNWVSPCGTWVLVPKDEGQGVIVFAFQSREFGFGFIMSPEQLQQVNDMRRGKKCKDEEAAISRLGKAYKKDLLKSPFIKEFEYGASNEGYWYYDHMVLHLRMLLTASLHCICSTITCSCLIIHAGIRSKEKTG
jgi:hypothetical protein